MTTPCDEQTECCPCVVEDTHAIHRCEHDVIWHVRAGQIVYFR